MANLVISGDTSGSVTLSAPAVSGTTVLTLPTTSGTLVTTGGGSTGSFTTLTSSGASSFATSSGNVGIGITNPDVKLHVDGTGTQYIKLSSSTNSNFIQTFATSGSTGHEYKSVYRLVDTDAGERMRITSTGVMYLGALATNFSFTNGSAVDISGSGTGIAGNGTNLTLGVWNGPMVFQAGNNGSALTERMRIDSAGNVGIGTSSPSARLDLTTATAGFATILTNTNGASDSNGLYVKSGTGSTEYNLRLSNTSGSTDFMVVKGNGNVGIGISGPSRELTVYGTGPSVQLQNATTGTANTDGLQIQQSGLDAYIWNWEGGAQVFATSGTERMRIDSSGNLLVNTTSAGGTVTIRGNTSPTQPALYIQSYPTSLPCASIYRDNTDAQYCLKLRHDGPVSGGGNGYMIVFTDRSDVTVGSITVAGSTTAYNTSSDYRLKENIAPMTGALAKVSALKPVTYDWKSGGSSQGFIAHELAEVVPDCVTGEKDAVDANGKPKYQGVDTSFLVATLTAAIQEQQALITQLQLDVAALKGTK